MEQRALTFSLNLLFDLPVGIGQRFARFIRAGQEELSGYAIYLHLPLRNVVKKSLTPKKTRPESKRTMLEGTEAISVALFKTGLPESYHKIENIPNSTYYSIPLHRSSVPSPRLPT